MSLLVAAINALDRTKAKADFVCAGVDDQTQIVAAINLLPASGGRIELSEGDFHLSQTLQLVAKRIELAGQGRRSTTLRFEMVGDGIMLLGSEHGLRDFGVINNGQLRYGILINESAYNRLERLYIESPMTAGVWGNVPNSQNYLGDVRVWNSAGYGFHMFGVANRYVNCHAVCGSDAGLGGLAAFWTAEKSSIYVGPTAQNHETGFEFAGDVVAVTMSGIHSEGCSRGILIQSRSPELARGLTVQGGMVTYSRGPTAAVCIERGANITVAGLTIRTTESGKSVSVLEPVMGCMLVNNRYEDAVPYNVHPNADVTIIR